MPPLVPNSDAPPNRFLRVIQSTTNGLNKTAIAIVFIVGVFALIAYYLYLTNNRYYILTSEKGVAYEVDRRTGDTWVLHGTTKRLQEEYRPVNRRLKAIPYPDKSKITGNGSLGYGSFSGKLYNGSDWTVKEVVFQITAKEEDGSVRWSRQLKKEITIEPLSTEYFSVTVSGEQKVGSFTWHLDQARGYLGD